MKKGKLIEINQETIIVCDNPDCKYEIKHVEPKDATAEELEPYFNKPCPECGSNLLTEHDYMVFKRMMKIVNFINKWFGWITYLIPLKDSEVVNVHYHDGKTTISKTEK